MAAEAQCEHSIVIHVPEDVLEAMIALAFIFERCVKLWGQFLYTLVQLNNAWI